MTPGSRCLETLVWTRVQFRRAITSNQLHMYPKLYPKLIRESVEQFHNISHLVERSNHVKHVFHMCFTCGSHVLHICFTYASHGFMHPSRRGLHASHLRGVAALPRGSAGRRCPGLFLGLGPGRVSWAVSPQKKLLSYPKMDGYGCTNGKSGLK